jgi:hypothetical protein
VVEAGLWVEGYNPGMFRSLRFLWSATCGNRLQPWKSPYLRWRFETYTGKRAETVTLGDFVALIRREWRQLLHFLRWTNEIQEYARPVRE